MTMKMTSAMVLQLPQAEVVSRAVDNPLATDVAGFALLDHIALVGHKVLPDVFLHHRKFAVGYGAPPDGNPYAVVTQAENLIANVVQVNAHVALISVLRPVALPTAQFQSDVERTHRLVAIIDEMASKYVAFEVTAEGTKFVGFVGEREGEIVAQSAHVVDLGLAVVDAKQVEIAVLKNVARRQLQIHLMSVAHLIPTAQTALVKEIGALHQILLLLRHAHFDFPQSRACHLSGIRNFLHLLSFAFANIVAHLMDSSHEVVRVLGVVERQLTEKHVRLSSVDENVGLVSLDAGLVNGVDNMSDVGALNDDASCLLEPRLQRSSELHEGHLKLIRKTLEPKGHGLLVGETALGNGQNSLVLQLFHHLCHLGGDAFQLLSLML